MTENPSKSETAQVVPFPDAEERARRLRVEVERLAELSSPVERQFWLEGAAEKHGIEPAKMKAMIEATIKAKEKKVRQEKAEQQRIEQRAEKQRATAKRDEERKQERKGRDEERKQEREEREARKEAKRKDREKQKAFAAIAKLPVAEHETRLIALAKRLDEDLEFLRDEFAEFAAIEETASERGYIEPWPEPVDACALLTEAMTQVRRYVVMQDDAAIAVTLWIVFAWLHEIAVHSPHLVFTSAEGDTGKTTACGVINFLTPRGYLAAEFTGPSLYRFVDHMRPTLIIDDADNLLQRRRDLVHIVNVSWTRGTKIPRQEHGVTRWFNPF